MTKKKEKVSEVQESKEKNYSAQIPLCVVIQFRGKEEDREEVVDRVLAALQLVSKFQFMKVGNPIFEEHKENGL